MRKRKFPQFMTVRRSADGTERYYWQPSRGVKALGFNLTALGCVFSDAVKQANRLNEILADFKNTPKMNDLRPVVKRAGTFAALFDEYKTTTYWQKLRKRTQNGYISALKIPLKIFGDVPVALIRRQDAISLYNTAAKAHATAANAMFRAFRLVMNYAVDCEYITSNPVARIKMLTVPPRRSVWSKEAEKAFCATCDKYGRPSVKLAFILSLYAGQRQGDVLALTNQNLINVPGGKEIHLTQSKTGAYLEIPCAAAVCTALAETRKTANVIDLSPNAPLVVNETTGKRWTSYAFIHAFADLRDRAARDFPEIDFTNLQFIDLRRTCVVRMAEGRATIPEITAVTGHKVDQCMKIIETYLPRTRKMAASAISKLEAVN